MKDIKKKIENILHLSESERYDYFIRKVSDFEQIWGLNNGGWALLGDDNQNKVFPFWPEREFAELCANGQWDGFQPKSISLNDFLEKWIPGMLKDNISVNIFFTPSAKGTTVDPKTLSDDLNEELDQYN